MLSFAAAAVAAGVTVAAGVAVGAGLADERVAAAAGVDVALFSVMSGVSADVATGVDVASETGVALGVSVAESFGRSGMPPPSLSPAFRFIISPYACFEQNPLAVPVRATRSASLYKLRIYRKIPLKRCKNITILLHSTGKERRCLGGCVKI